MMRSFVFTLCTAVSFDFVAALQLMSEAYETRQPPGQHRASNGPALTQQKKANTYALAFHGEFQRIGLRPPSRDGKARFHNSDFFECYDNIKSTIIEPLHHDGGTVLTYVDTFRSPVCEQKDHQLISLLKPRKYNFTDTEVNPHDPKFRQPAGGIVDSYIRVLNMIKEDEAPIDFIILLRFDVMYHKPITSLPINWHVTNAAFRDQETWWNECKMISDVFFVLPKHHLQPMIDALEWSGSLSTQVLPCSHAGGVGHFAYEPFVKAMGAGSMQFIDKEYMGASSYDFEENKTFLGINRIIGPDFHNC